MLSCRRSGWLTVTLSDASGMVSWSRRQGDGSGNIELNEKGTTDGTARRVAGTNSPAQSKTTDGKGKRDDPGGDDQGRCCFPRLVIPGSSGAGAAGTVLP